MIPKNSSIENCKELQEERKNKNASPQTQNQIVELTKIFRFNDFGFIVADQETVNWLTESSRPLSTGEIARVYLDPEQSIGVGFKNKTNYLLVDVDRLSKNHPQIHLDAFSEIKSALESIGLVRSLAIQSSNSGGIHLYFPLPEDVNTFELAAAAKVTLINAGFDIKAGELELFPNAKKFAIEGESYTHYNKHRLPLQPESGSFLMEDDGLTPQPIAPDRQLEEFIKQWHLAAQGQDIQLLKRKLPQLYKKYKDYKNRAKYQGQGKGTTKTKKAIEFETDLDKTLEIGWIGFHYTQEMVKTALKKAIVFLGLTGEAAIDWMVNTLVNCPGYREFCRHQHEIRKIVKSWVESNEKNNYYQPYCSHPQRPNEFPGKKLPRKPNPANAKESDNAAFRIRNVYALVRNTFGKNTTIEQMRVAIRAKMVQIYGIACSNNTLTRHKIQWHPKYLTTLNIEPEKQPQTSQDNNNSEYIDTLENSSQNAQTITEQVSDRPKNTMICGGFENSSPHTKSPKSRAACCKDEVDTEDNLEVVDKAGKFEILGTAIAKMIALAAVVLTISGSFDPPAESSPAPTPIPPQPKVEVAIADAGDNKPLHPCDDSRIPSFDPYPYNPNQVGVPWESEQERNKFAGYLMLRAKQDKSIENPHAWVVTTLKNLKERGFNSYWMDFIGDRPVDPNFEGLQFLSELNQKNQNPTIKINRPAERLDAIVDRIAAIPPTTTRSELIDSADKKIAPIDDETIRPWYSLEYKEQCNNAPWTDRPQDFYKFCGFMLMVVAKRERERDPILNIYKWANQTIKQRTNIDKYWAEFIGVEMVSSEAIG